MFGSKPMKMSGTNNDVTILTLNRAYRADNHWPVPCKMRRSLVRLFYHKAVFFIFGVGRILAFFRFSFSSFELSDQSATEK